MQELLSLDDVSGDIAAPATRAKILELEAQLAAMPQIDIPVTHRYSGGIYAREITIPAGTILTGTIYLDDHFDVMVSGRILTSGPDGMKDLSGFHIFKGNQGKKRAGVCIEDTRWITFHSSPELLDDMYLPHLTAGTFEALDAEIETRKGEDEQAIRQAFESYSGDDFTAFRAGYMAAKGLDDDDYRAMLAELGVTESLVRAQSESMDDRRDIASDNVYVADSEIEGQGLFSKRAYSAGDFILAARIDGLRTQAGRYSNHSDTPNAKMVAEGNNIILVAVSDIDGDEITTDYRATVEVVRGLECQA